MRRSAPQFVLAACLLTACGSSDKSATATPTQPTPTAPAVATTLTLSRSQAAFTALGDSTLVTATVTDQRGQAMQVTVAWASSAPAVAAASAAGVIKALTVGTATITATSGALTATVAVTVSQVPTQLRLGAARLVFSAVNQRDSTTAAVLDARNNPVAGATVAWTSSNAAVATVSATGAVTARASGLAQLTATSGSLTAKLPVTVNAWSGLSAQVVGMIQGSIRDYPDNYIPTWAIADFNNDGNEDLVVSPWYVCAVKGCGTGAPRNPAAAIKLFQRTSGGGMQDVTAAMFVGAFTAYANYPSVADFNNDGVSDLFFAGFTDVPPEDATSRIAISNGTGYAVTDDNTLVWAHGFGAWDLNKDGCMDALVGDEAAPIWKGDCTGRLTRMKYADPQIMPIQGYTDRELHLLGNAMGVCIGDFNKDGSSDVVNTDAIVALKGTATWTPLSQDNVILDVDWTQAQPKVRAAYALPRPVLDSASAPGRIKSHDMRCGVADLDRDGDDDIFISSTPWPDDNTSWGGSQFQVYLNDGNWTFRDVSLTAFPGRSFNSPFGFLPLLRDLDGDGAPDLFFSGKTASASSIMNPVWMGNGNGTFRVGSRVDLQALRVQAQDVVNAYANLTGGLAATAAGEIAPIRRATGEYDFIVSVLATDGIAKAGSPYGTPSVFVVFIPAGVRF